MEIQCPVPNCDYKTQEMEPQYAMQHFMLHNSAVHIVKADKPSYKAEALKRPPANLDMSQAEWQDFESQWSRCKRSTGQSDKDAVDQFLAAALTHYGWTLTVNTDLS